MAYTYLTNSTTADADEVNANIEFVREGSLLPLGKLTNGVMEATTSIYDIGSSTYKWRDGFYSGSVTVSELTASNGVDSGGGMKTVTYVVSIGNWDMDASGSKTVPLSGYLSDFKKIRSVTGVIRNDADTNYYPFGGNDSASSIYIRHILDPNESVVIIRANGSFWDDPGFDSMTTADNNRGWLTVVAEP